MSTWRLIMRKDMLGLFIAGLTQCKNEEKIGENDGN
jgi:hypothetical protein